MKVLIKFNLYFMLLLVSNACVAMTGEIGKAIIEDMRTGLKEPFLELLASSELIDRGTFEKRLLAAKSAISTFESKIG